MKNLILKSVLILFVLASLTSCKKAKEKIATSVFEKAYESATGEKIETVDFSNVEKNTVVFDLNFEDPEIGKYLTGEESKGMVTAMEDAMSITAHIDGGEGGVLMTFNGDNLKDKKPIKGGVGQDISFTFSVLIMNKDVGMLSWSSEDAVGELVTLSDKKAVVKTKGTVTKLGGDEKTTFDGTVTIDYPIFQAMGASKKDFSY